MLRTPGTLLLVTTALLAGACSKPETQTQGTPSATPTASTPPRASSATPAAAAPTAAAEFTPTGEGCPTGMMKIPAQLSKLQVCAKLPPAPCKYDGKFTKYSCESGSNSAFFVEQDSYDACMKMAKDKAHEKGTTFVSEGDMPSGHGHWFERKTAQSRYVVACVKGDKAFSCDSETTLHDNIEGILAVCKDATPAKS